ncbi:MAG: winged helix-turn-helix domain-containing protein [Candidatus Micrarchaeia archaeon]|jgi:DNA-binding transcriptional ArsR family regulator
MDAMKRLLFWLLEGTKGGPTRITLLSLLHRRPMNLRQLSLAAGIDYKTAEHHVDLLRKNSVLECSGEGYGKIYFISDIALAQKDFAGMIRGGKNGGKEKK